MPIVSTGLEHLVSSVPWASIDANPAAGIVESLDLVSCVHLENIELCHTIQEWKGQRAEFCPERANVREDKSLVVSLKPQMLHGPVEARAGLCSYKSRGWIVKL